MNVTSHGCTGCSSSMLLSIDGSTTKGFVFLEDIGSVSEGTRHIVGIAMQGPSNLGYTSNHSLVYPISDNVLLHIRGQRSSHQPRSNPFRFSHAGVADSPSWQQLKTCPRSRGPSFAFRLLDPASETEPSAVLLGFTHSNVPISMARRW